TSRYQFLDLAISASRLVRATFFVSAHPCLSAGTFAGFPAFQSEICDRLARLDHCDSAIAG
ncbi:hypothetical protein, partial [Rhodococcus sp. AJR001]